MNGMARIVVFLAIANNYAVKARLVDTRLVELEELCLGRIARVLEEYTDHIRRLLTNVREVMYVIFPEGMRFAEQATSSELRSQGKSQGSAPTSGIPSKRQDSLPGPPKKKKGKQAERNRETRPTDEETESNAAVKPHGKVRVKRRFIGGSPSKAAYPPETFSSVNPSDQQEVRSSTQNALVSTSTSAMVEVVPDHRKPQTPSPDREDEAEPLIPEPVYASLPEELIPMEEEPAPQPEQAAMTFQLNIRRTSRIQGTKETGLVPSPRLTTKAAPRLSSSIRKPMVEDPSEYLEEAAPTELVILDEEIE